MSAGNLVAFLLLIHEIFISLIGVEKTRGMGENVCNRLQKFSLLNLNKRGKREVAINKLTTNARKIVKKKFIEKF